MGDPFVHWRHRPCVFFACLDSQVRVHRPLAARDPARQGLLAMQYLVAAHRFIQAPHGRQHGFADVRRSASGDVSEDDPELPWRHGQSSVDCGAGQPVEWGDRRSSDPDAEPEREHLPPYSPQQERALQRRVGPSTTAAGAVRRRLNTPLSPKELALGDSRAADHGVSLNENWERTGTTGHGVEKLRSRYDPEEEEKKEEEDAAFIAGRITSPPKKQPAENLVPRKCSSKSFRRLLAARKTELVKWTSFDATRLVGGADCENFWAKFIIHPSAVGRGELQSALATSQGA